VNYGEKCESIFFTFHFVLRKLFKLAEMICFIFFTFKNYIEVRFNSFMVSALKLEAAGSLKVRITIYQTLWHHQVSTPESKNMCSSLLMNS